jgi:hypothetical protein
VTRRAAPIDLGRLSAIDESSLKPGVVLWGRFCAIEPPRETGGERGDLIVTVTDLERDPKRTLGDGPHLELHRLRAPVPERPRWQRALGINNRVQARVHAYAYLEDGSLVVLSEPAVGVPLAEITPSLTLDGRRLSVFAFELAGLLAAFHQVGTQGIRFRLERLRVSDGHYHVDGFTHLQPHDDGRDLEAFVELIRKIGGDAAKPLLTPPPTSPMDLRHRLRPQIGAGNVYDLPPEPPFVGREAALASLNNGFSQAQIAKPTTIIVRGPRGVGKSRLLREFVAQRLKANDSLVLTAARESQSADTRGGLLGALDQLPRAMARFDEDERDDIRMRINRATRGVGAIVARSAPSLGAVLRRVEVLPPLELGEDFTRHTAVIAELFRSLGTSKRPLIVVLDNLESANSSAIAVLKILAEANPAHHSLIVMGLRTDAGGHEPAGLEAERLELAPLQVDEVVELLTQMLPGAVENVDSVADALWSSSDGTPLALWASLQAWLDRGLLTHSVDDGVWRLRGLAARAAEPAIRSLFGPRLTAASKAVREFSLHAAVLGTDISDDEVRYLCDMLGVSDREDVIDDVVGLGILIRARNGLRSPHSSIREFVQECFDESELRAAHDRVAKMLTERQAPVAQIAYHRDLAFDPNGTDPGMADRLSRLHVEAGRERLTVYDLERARWHLERALEHSRDSDHRRIAAEGLADVCLLLKDIDTAVSLYTAIIATAEGLQSLQIAGKVAQYLFFQSAFAQGRQLGAMAFEQVGEPTPTTTLAKIGLILRSVFRSWWGPPKVEPALRDALLRLHLWLAQMCFIDDPLAVLGHVARGHWLAQEHETSPAAMVLSVEAYMWAAGAGRYDVANRLFARGVDITTNKSKDIWGEGYVRHNWSLILFSENRYEEAQDMSDDAIGAFREAGDTPATALTIMFKGLYGRDREPAERVLRWFDEAIGTSRRNGKTLCLVSLECLKLHIFARQGRTDLKPLLLHATELIEHEDAAIDRLIARTHLAFAAFECSEWEIGVVQVRKAVIEFAEGPGVPEFCQDFFLVATLILMELPNPSKADRKLFRSTQRKFRNFAKRGPRLRCYTDFLDLKLAVKARNEQKIRSFASKIIAEVGVHENLYTVHHAHRALSVLLKGEAVLEAAEHERMARKYGRRLGLGDFMLVEVQDELLEHLGLDTEPGLLDSQAYLPAAGMLASSSNRFLPAPKLPRGDDTSEVVATWALTGPATTATSLSAILEPVRGAASKSIGEDRLELSCTDPNATVPIESSDLQILIINMLLACQDTLDPNAKFNVVLKIEQVETKKSLGRIDNVEPGRYLSIRASGRGMVVQNPVIGAFSTCENLASGLGGRLAASTEKASTTLMALIPIVEADAAETGSVELPACVIVHPDEDVRELIGAALEQLGAAWRAFEPHDFGPANINRAKVILADGGALDDLVVLGPLLDARLIEIVKEDAEPMFHDQERLRLPIVQTELLALLRG